jgi:alanyl-tRNA synthetase
MLRRILRRAVMYGRRLGLEPGFFTQLVVPTVGNLGHIFSELREKQAVIEKVIASEESAFDRTLDRGMSMFEDICRMHDTHDALISGKDAFVLYDTYGFPLDLTEILATEKGFKIDHAGFVAEMEAQRQRARDAQKKTVVKVAGDGESTKFVGYDAKNLSGFETEVLERIEQDGTSYLVTPATPFYAEMGGQVGDQGTAHWGNWHVRITDTIRDEAGRHLHKLSAPMQNAEPGTPVTLSVDIARRRDIQRHHSATHILNWALRDTLGDHVLQAGSFVGPDRLRFDFNHFEAVSATELAEIEAKVNAALVEDDEVIDFETPFAEKPEDVIATFGEKYGNVVRVVDIGGWSKELCGGTHVQRIGEIGQLRLVAESSISAGVRRIEAVCAVPAADYTAREHRLLTNVASALSVKPAEAPARVQALLEKLREAEKTIAALQAEAAKAKSADLSSQVEEIHGVKFLAAALDGVDAQGLRDAMDDLRSKLDPAVIVLGGSADGKVFFNVSVADECQSKGAHAGKLIAPVAKACGGGGGGKADRAQAGGKQPENLEEALKVAKETLTSMLS